VVPTPTPLPDEVATEGVGFTWSSFATTLLLLQLALLWFTATPHLPTAADRAAGEGLVRRLAAFDGEVMVPYHGNLARMAGKRMGAHDMALGDVLRAKSSPATKKLDASIRDAIRTKRYAAIVTDRSWWADEVDKTYVKQRPAAVPTPGEFNPRTGWIIRPTTVLVPIAAGKARTSRRAGPRE
jgi:hypothetical protein